MIKVTIEGKEYELKNKWDDLTLEEYEQVCKVKIPSSLKKKYELMLQGKFEEVQDGSYRDIVKTHPKFFGEIIALCSNIPKEVIQYLHWIVRTKLYNEFLAHFVESQLSTFPLIIDDKGVLQYFEGCDATSFILNGEQYYLPESLQYGGVKVPMYKEKIATFAEAADIEIAVHDFAEKGVEAMAQFCAVYLRKEGEEHTDELVIARTEQFKKLPMSVVWEVFFCTTRLGVKFVNDILLSSEATNKT